MKGIGILTGIRKILHHRITTGTQTNDEPLVDFHLFLKHPSEFSPATFMETKNGHLGGWRGFFAERIRPDL